MASTAVVDPPITELTDLATAILVRVGTPEEAADTVARTLVTADRMGHASHGVIRLLEYSRFARDGQVVAAAVPQVVATAGSTAVVDGRWGWGQVAAELAARTAADLADRLGVGLVGVRNCNHAGRLGEWVELIAGRRLVGVGFLSCGPTVAAPGGAERVLGTNPIAFGVPTAGEPLVLDLATAGIAEGKLRVARRAGQAVAEGLIQTADGEPTTDPEDYYAGGSLLPFGGHKGYGLSVLIQVLGEALTGGGEPGERTRFTNGLVLLAFAPDRLRDWPEFAAAVEATTSRIAGSRAVPGRQILLPGDVERATLAGQPPDRVRLPAALWQELHRLAAEPTA